jgi:phosphoribosylformylglycinamidine synthase
MSKVAVYVTPKQGIADPQGATIERALPALGFEGVANVRVGRFITLEIEGADEAKMREELDAMCRRLLVNPIIEDYCFTIGEGAAAGASGEAGQDAPSPWTVVDPFASRPEEVE